MKNKAQANPWALSAPIDKSEDLRKMIFGSDYAQRDAEREYLMGLISEQQRDPRAGKPQEALV